MSPDTDTPLRVLVAGGGVAGLEALLALRDLAGERVTLTLLAPEREFTYRPMAVAVPFGRGHMQRRDLADVARDTGAQFVRGELAEVDAAAREAVLADGRRLGYDALLVAVGAGSEPAYSRVRTWTPELDQEVFGGLLADLEEGYAKKVAFVIPPHVAWPLPGVRARADDGVGRPRHGPGRRAGHGVHPGGRAARDLRRAGVGRPALRPRGGGRDGRTPAWSSRRIRPRAPA